MSGGSHTKQNHSGYNKVEIFYNIGTAIINNEEYIRKDIFDKLLAEVDKLRRELYEKENS